MDVSARNYTSKLCFSGVWPSFFVTIIFALPSSRYLLSPFQALFTTSCFALFYVYNFVLLYPALNDWPFMKYASNYFSFVRRLLACLSCITLPALSLNWSHTRAFLLIFFFSRLV